MKPWVATLIRGLRDPFGQAIAALVLFAAVLVLAPYNHRGLSCFVGEGSCLEPAVLPLLLGLAMVAALLFAGPLARLGLTRTEAPLRGPEALGLLGVLGLGGLLRLGHLGTVPPFLDYDTAQNGWIALTLWEQLPTHGYQPVLLDWATGNEAAYLYLVGLSLKVFGVSVEALRLPSALMGTLTVLAITLVGRKLFSPALGLLAGLLAAVTPWHIEMSRGATREILTALFVALGLWLLAKGLSATTGRRAWLFLVLCGLSVGAGLNSYEAFRIFPLAIAASLVLVRLRQGRIKQGLLELLVVAGCAVLVVLPIAIYVYHYPEAYFEHISTNSILYEVSEQKSIIPILRNIAQTLAFFVFQWPSTPHADFGVAAPLFLISPLFVAGLFGLLLRWRAPGDPERQARVLLLVTLLFMAAPFALARFSLFAPRRYSGELTPLCILAAGAILGILRGVGTRLGRPGQAVLTVLLVGGLLFGLTSSSAAIHELLPQYRYPRAERLLRHALTLAEDNEVYLAPGAVDPSYLADFFLKHPRLSMLPSAWPLPDGPLARGDAVLISRGEPFWEALRTTFGARRQEVTLEGPQGVPTERITVYRIDRKAMRKRRFSEAEGARELQGQLLVTQPGRYRFKPPDGVTATVEVGATQRTLPDDGHELAVHLAAGLHSIYYRALRGLGRPLWRLPGSERFVPLPASRLWRLPDGAFPRAPRTREAAFTVGPAQVTVVPAEDSYLHMRVLQQARPMPSGYDLFDLDRYPLKRFDPEAGWPTGEPKPRLLLAPGEPYEVPESYEYDAVKAFAFGSLTSGLVLLERASKTLLRFDDQGLLQARIEAGLEDPMDVTALGETIYVADRGRGAILVLSASEAGKALNTPRPLVTGIRPVAVAASNGRLAYLDQLHHQLVFVDLRDADLGGTVQLGQVASDMRLSLDAEGLALISSPRDAEVLLVSPDGEVLSLNQDPRGLSGLLSAATPRPPVAACRSLERKELLVLTQPDTLVRLPLRTPPTDSP